jgi:conjugal transfer pilus assembly protein TraF
MSSLFLTLFCSACEADYFRDHERGWHWYQAEPEPDDDKKNDQTSPQNNKQSPLEKLKQYQEKLETAKAEAVLNPTPQNVAAYQKLQYELLEKSHNFANVWMQNVYKNPSLDYSTKSPTSQNARHAYLQEEGRKREEKIFKLSKEYGLFYFFKKNCSYCDAFAPVVKKFSEKYHWEVLAISEFGEANELFSRNVRDNGLAETWGVSVYPSLFAVNPKTGDVIPVANGMISIEEMEDRITAIGGKKHDED